MKHNLAIKAVIIFMMVFIIAACTSGAEEGTLSASGSISAASVNISPEVSGTIQEVYIQAGDEVKVGDALFAINDEFIKAQSDQAAAGLSLAQAGLTAALEQQNAAEVQLAQALQGARYQEYQANVQNPTIINWSENFDLPQWYFDDAETINALQAEVDSANTALIKAQSDLSQVVEDFGDQTLIDLETDLARMQQAYILTRQQLDGYQLGNASQLLIDTTQENLDEIVAEIDSLQLSYDRSLSDTASQDLLDARAKVQAAQDYLDLTLLALDQKQVGDQSLMVQVAQANVALAAANVAQAEAGLEQAQAAEALMALQMKKTTVYAPLDGVILSESLAVGELVGAGAKALIIAQLDQVELTVYIPEDQYGTVALGQSVQVTVDSFPDRAFTGEVVYIADEAEFTPRNVQTVEGRKATVFAIQIQIPNPDYELKPGMTADVIFE